MCEKCRELDKQIENYRRLLRSASDRPTVDHYKELISELFGQKLDLHTTPA
jgi:hypothetical protein